jgi:hypothetical protein
MVKALSDWTGLPFRVAEGKGGRMFVVCVIGLPVWRRAIKPDQKSQETCTTFISPLSHKAEVREDPNEEFIALTTAAVYYTGLLWTATLKAISMVQILNRIFSLLPNIYVVPIGYRLLFTNRTGDMIRPYGVWTQDSYTLLQLATGSPCLKYKNQQSWAPVHEQKCRNTF